MRITNNMMVNRSLGDINSNLNRLDRVQQDLTTGKRIHRPSDDPTANARAMVLKGNKAQNTQYADNIATAQAQLNITDSTMGEMTNAMMRLRQLMVQGANGNLRTQDRNAIAQEANQLRDEFRALANTQVNGRYIFGGLKTQTQPLPSDVTLGPNDTGKLTLEIGPGLTMDYNVTAVQLFGDTTPPNTEHLFDVIDEFVGFLGVGNSTPDISETSLARLDGYLDKMKTARTEVGGKLNRLDLADSRLTEINLGIDKLLEHTEATDVTEASLRLNQYEATHQAALAVAARAIPQSLVDYLR